MVCSFLDLFTPYLEPISNLGAAAVGSCSKALIQLVVDYGMVVCFFATGKGRKIMTWTSHACMHSFIHTCSQNIVYFAISISGNM